jgi:toxin YoeB
MVKLTFAECGWEDYLYWQTHDKAMSKRINELIKEISRTPYEGRGKPERLSGARSEFWSRRIDKKHRIVYRVTSEAIEIVQCRGHYDDK